jgi:hypothetical protein
MMEIKRICVFMEYRKGGKRFNGQYFKIFLQDQFTLKTIFRIYTEHLAVTINVITLNPILFFLYRYYYQTKVINWLGICNE